MTVDDQLALDAIAASAGATRTYEIRHVPEHAYVKGPKGARGCKVDGCGRARANPVHHMPTMNGTLTNDWRVYQAAKQAWGPFLVGLLEGSGLPKDLRSVMVEGLCCFPTRAKRDQDNHRAFVAKALGDALVAGGWIPDDSWDHYQFDGMAKRYEKGVRWTELRLFPNALG